MLKSVAVGEKTREEIDEITQTLKSNLEKVVQHGKRAELHRQEHAVAFAGTSGRRHRRG